jgi:sulfite reductase (ferredoxin)
VKASNDRWRAALADRVPAELAAEIDVFESEIALRKQNRIEERVFAETRLRRGVYGQRYDNGHRYDGRTERTLEYPSGELTKGPDTAWDAPGMQRIKIPYGGMNARQLEVMADLAEEYSDGIAHVTTRQDFQLHFIHVDDTPALMRRLSAVGITTREACGNSVRNVTACPIAGVCHDEVFDVTPYANACAQFLLGHPDVQDFGRKFKIAFSGCKDQPCGLVMLHDMGAIAVERTRDDGTVERGFELYVGGGLGSVPFQAKMFDGFVPPEELLPLSQAISRVYARLGEKKNRAAARIKFLIKKLGIDEFRRLVLAERAELPDDPRWRQYIEEAKRFEELPLKAGAPTNGVQPPAGFGAWSASNVYRQRQPGYATVTITLPLGDITARQLRKLADIARTYVRETVRTTVEQNMVLRWVSEADLPALYRELAEVDLHAPGAGTIVDITACPGTDTCKLGIASSRGLAGEIRERLLRRSMELDEVIRGLRIKVSGCFNSCGQHHVADIGFYGTSRTIKGHKVPHFQVVLGGQWTKNAGSYGLAMGSAPARNVPEVLERITGRYLEYRSNGESFQDFVRSVGKKDLRAMLQDLLQVPAYEVDSSFYSDWGDPREFSMGDLGTGECAGEVVTLTQFNLASAEQLVFEAQLRLDDMDFAGADSLSYRAMVEAARALVKTEILDVPGAPDTVVSEFRRRFYDTGLFSDKYAGGKFANYLFRRHQSPPESPSRDTAHQVVEESQLFIEAAHACYERMAREISGVH